MRKKSISYNYEWLGQSEKVQLCDEKDCCNPGTHYAPKSPNSKERYLFCIDHIKIYNKRWNFFAGKSQKQIYDFQKNDFFENRPTRPFSRGFSSKIKFEFKNFFCKEDIKFKERSGKNGESKNFKLNTTVENALKIFKINTDFSEKLLKRRYKELVKKYHPDLNKNYLNKENKIKEINSAYNTLIKFVKNQ